MITLPEPQRVEWGYTADQVQVIVAAAIAELPPAPKPKPLPMKTAPKDGTRILVQLVDSDAWHVICWVDVPNGINTNFRNEPDIRVGWTVSWDGHSLEEWEPLHWLPLPADFIPPVREAAPTCTCLTGQVGPDFCEVHSA